MSVIRCQGRNCITPIDTDLDTECVIDDPRHSLAGHPDLILCPRCRQRLADEQDAATSHPTDEELIAAGCGGIK